MEAPGVPLVTMDGGYQRYSEENLVNGRKLTQSCNVGLRLAMRKKLAKKRITVNDIALAFALVGLLLAIVESEFVINKVFAKSDARSIIFKLLVTISTVILLVFVAWYHLLDLQIFMCDNSVDNWRLVITLPKIAQISIELLLCCVHPLPGDFGLSLQADQTAVPVDVYLIIPMFLRVYLVFRTIMLHSRLYKDIASQSLGAFNRVHLNGTFVFRSMVNLYPEYVLAALVASVFLSASWLLHVCDEVRMSMPNSMWVIAVTFLTIGYGDIVPLSYCGRSITVMTGAFGVGVTALIVAVLARKLELTGAEKYVHNFVIEIELDKSYKTAAANILKTGWYVYKYTNLTQQDGLAMTYRRRLLTAIGKIREIKQAKRRIVDSSVSPVEIFKLQNSTSSLIDALHNNQLVLIRDTDHLLQRMKRLEEKLDAIHNKL